MNKHSFFFINILFFLMIQPAIYAIHPSKNAIEQHKTKAIKAYVYNEKGSDKELAKEVRNLLSNEYFTVVSMLEEADALIKLTCETTKGEIIRGDMYNFREYFSTVQIQVEDINNSKILHEYSISNHRSLSSASSSEISAKNNAIKDVMKVVRKELKKEWVDTE